MKEDQANRKRGKTWARHRTIKLKTGVKRNIREGREEGKKKRMEEKVIGQKRKR